MKKLNLGILGLIAASGFLFGVNGVNANSIQLQTNVGTNPAVSGSPSDFTWTYTMEITSSDNIAPGDYFTIIDFAGFISTDPVVLPAGWTLYTPTTLGTGVGLPNSVSSTSGYAPSGIPLITTSPSSYILSGSNSAVAADDSTITDLVLVWNQGGDTSLGNGTSANSTQGDIVGETGGLVFSFDSIYGGGGPNRVLDLDSIQNSLGGDSGIMGVDNTADEVPESPLGSTSTPLPAVASMGMTMFGLFFVGLAGRKLARRASMA